MTVKILIKRKVSQHQSEELGRLLTQMRVLTMGQRGYVSGETLRRIDMEGQCLVLSTWQSADDWRRWVLSSQRRELQEQIDALLGQPTEYEIYENI